MGYRTYTCPIAKQCGGCEWLAVPYPIQLERKQASIEELFGKACEKDGGTIEPICGMKKPAHYRCKAATPFAPGRKGRILSGFYARGSHHIVRCDSCLVEDPRARKVLTAVARTAEDLRIPAYQEDKGRGLLRHAIVRCGWKTDDVLLTIITNGERIAHEKEFVKRLRYACPELTSIVQNVNMRRTNAILGSTSRTLWGAGVMHDELLGCTFEIGPTSFYQTNPAQTEVLYRLAINAATKDHEPGRQLRVLDAYCGTGTIGLCLAHAVPEAQVMGVEQVADAVRSARRNARANGLADRSRFVAADATQWMAQLDPGSDDAHFDAVILDPPRAGSTESFLRGICRLAPGRVVYVSCNINTQARDLEVLRQGGYRIESVTGVDMFPHTKHVETVVLMSRVKD